MPNDFAPVMGRAVTFEGEPNPHWDGIVSCKVLVVEEPTRLSYTWRGGGLNSVVTWTLAPSPAGGTLLHLEHTGFSPKDAMAFHGILHGWQLVPRLLEPVLQGL